MKNNSNDYVTRLLASPLDVDASDWNALLAAQSPGAAPSPFLRHEYLAALHQSGSAAPDTGWTPCFITLWQNGVLAAACPLYLKTHSYGEYVFDWAWANAYQQHGLRYYPKAVAAVPFTPVPGPRLLARNAAERLLLAKTLLAWCEAEKLSSLHLLFTSDEDVAACEEAGLMLRHTVQFHWTNKAPTLATACAALPPEGADPCLGRPGAGVVAPTLATACAALPPEGAGPPWGGPAAGRTSTLASGETPPSGYRDFDDFLMSLNQEKRKKIRQERRKVVDAGITFRWALGADISPADWEFFYRCYERTYLEHGNEPYLNRDFFQRMQTTMPENWLLFVAEYKGQPVATSLIALSARIQRAEGLNDTQADAQSERIAYGRYWGALARVDCLHFEACYYQPIAWCIEHGYARFEGGAQGEHKMARALLPVKTTSAHWLAHPAFANAVENFLEREGEGIEHYLGELQKRSPLRHTDALKE